MLWTPRRCWPRPTPSSSSLSRNLASKLRPRPPARRPPGGMAVTESTSLETHGPPSVVDPPILSEIGGDQKLNRGGVAWAIFEGGRDPYVILMTIYIFMPYVSAVMI